MFTKTTFCLLLCTILPCVGLGRSVIAAEPTFVPSIQPQLKNFRALDGARLQREWDEAPHGQAALGAVAFSVSGDNMASNGNETVVTYKTLDKAIESAEMAEVCAHLRKLRLRFLNARNC